MHRPLISVKLQFKFHPGMAEIDIKLFVSLFPHSVHRCMCQQVVTNLRTMYGQFPSQEFMQTKMDTRGLALLRSK